MGEQQDVTGFTGLKDPGLDAKGFTANGKEYTVSPSMSIARWAMYEELGVEIGLSRTFEQIQKDAVKGFDLCNRMAQGQHHLAELAIILRDMATACALVGSKEYHPALKMCCLFINYKGEDTRYITEELIAEKIHDWEEEGIAIGYFFRFALHSIPGFVVAYKASSPGTSERTEGSANPSGKKVSTDMHSGLPGTTPAPSSNG